MTDTLPEAKVEPRVGQDPGWYPYFNGFRFFDGYAWTEHMTFAPRTKPGLNVLDVIVAAFLGALLALFVVWLGAQFAPEHIYLPVKFVVDPQDFPNAFQ